MRDSYRAGLSSDSDKLSDGVKSGRVYRILVKILRDSGFPEPLIRRYHRRRRILSLLGQVKRGQDLGPAYANQVVQALQLPPVLRFLGRGNWGGSYLLEDDTVIKITTDAREARVSAALVGKPTRRIAATYGVWRLSIDGKPISYHGILRERITDAGNMRGPQGREAVLAMRYAAAFSSSAPPPPSDPEDDEPSGRRAREAAREIVDELDRHGILFEDYHPGNVGTREGLICLFDLSLARGPAADLALVEAPDPIGDEEGALSLD